MLSEMVNFPAPAVPRPLPPARPAHAPLYQDFSAPARPIPININVQTSALKCLIEWKHPTVPSRFFLHSFGSAV